MTPTHRSPGTILQLCVLVAITMTAPSATAQLSRARNAARRTTPPAPPAATIAPPAPAEKTEAKAAVTAAVRKPATVSAPTNTPPTKPAGRLSKAREKVRHANVPPAQPVHRPTPPPAPTPRPKPVRPPRRTSHPSRPHHAPSHCSAVPLFVPTYTTQTVIVEQAPVTHHFDDSQYQHPFIANETPDFVEPLDACHPMINAGQIPPPQTCAETILPFRFSDFPYQYELPGLMSRGLTKQWSGSVLFEYGSDFDRLSRRGFGGLIEHSSRIGIDFKWDSYVEDLGQGWSDELHFTNVNLLFRVAESERYLVRAGAGANILGDAYATDAGFNITATADLFPVKPLVISGEIDLGTIGDAETLHLLGKVGLVFERFEVFGGYDYRTIGSVPLQGAMLGLQVWF